MKFNLRDAWAAFFGGAQDAGVEIESGAQPEPARIFPAALAAEAVAEGALIQARTLAPGEMLEAVEVPADGVIRTAALGGGARSAHPAEPGAMGIGDAERAELEALRAQVAAAQAAQAQAAGDARQLAAAAFADRMVAEARALPAERDAIAAAHLKAAQADGELLSAIEAMYTARPAHTLAREAIPAGAGGTLAAPGAVTAERSAALLALTPLGRAAAQRTRGA